MKKSLNLIFSPLVVISRALSGRRRLAFGSALIVMVLAVSAAAAQAQQSPATLLAALEAEGFENLSVQPGAGGQGLCVAYENRRYRWEVAGLGVVLGLATAQQEGPLTVIPLHTGVPMARIKVDAADYRAFLRGELSEEQLFSRMEVSNRVEDYRPEEHNRSFGKVDLTFSPGVRVSLVTPAPPGTLHGGELRLNPGVYANLWRGVAFDGTYTYPFSTSKPVISRAAATYNTRLGAQGFFQGQAGRLAEGLDGFAAQASYLSPTGRSLLGVTLAQAGYPEMKRSTSYQAFYAWRPSDVDAVVTLSAGRFLDGDDGYSVGLVSGFGERSVEFFATKTNLSKTLGAGFTIPLGWQRQAYPGPVRLRFRNAFRFLYTDEKPPYGGGLTVPFNDGYQVATRRLNRAYLRLYAAQMREAGRRYLPASATELGK